MKGVEVKVCALTMVDPVTNLVKIVQVESTKTAPTAQAFCNTWLSQCPLPEKVLSDNGPEFSGSEWEFMLNDWSIKHACILSLLELEKQVATRGHTSHLVAPIKTRTGVLNLVNVQLTQAVKR